MNHIAATEESSNKNVLGQHFLVLVHALEFHWNGIYPSTPLSGGRKSKKVRPITRISLPSSTGPPKRRRKRNQETRGPIGITLCRERGTESHFLPAGFIIRAFPHCWMVGCTIDRAIEVNTEIHRVYRVACTYTFHDKFSAGEIAQTQREPM